MTFEEILDQAIALLQRRGRLTYRALKRQFDLDDDYLEDLKAELIKGQRFAVDEDGEVLVWTGDTAAVVAPAAAATPVQAQAPLAYTPQHLAAKILTSRSALEGERITTEVHRFEGTINQYTGDGVMALFGAPIAHEDGPRRAVHAALGIQRAIREVAQTLQASVG
jgi:class 3 adenylate cyclase